MYSPVITFKAQLQARGRACKTPLVVAVTLLSVMTLYFVMNTMCYVSFWGGEDAFA